MTPFRWNKSAAYCLMAFVMSLASPFSSIAYNIPISPGPDFDIGTTLSNYEAAGGSQLYLTALGNNLMGESHDIDTGALTFRQVDVSIPGNNNLSVEFARRANGKSYMYQNGLMMTSLGYVWDVDIPYVVTRVEKGLSGNCGATGTFLSYQASQSLDIGTKLYTPGSGTRDLGKTTAGIPVGSPDLKDYIPSSFAGYSGSNVRATRDLWIAKCAASSNFSGVVGHEVKAPNGNTYTFDAVKTYSATFRFTPSPNGPSGFQSSIDVDNVYMFPSKVTDVHGNWVQYQYNSHGVTRIWSNDGREITINYSGALISSVVANGRQWNYTYNSSGDKLSRIDLPDNETYWTFGDGAGMSNNGMVDADCWHKRVPYSTDQRTTIMRHPSGTVGHFETGVIFNPVRRVPNKPYSSPVGNGGSLGTEKTACSWGSLTPKLFMSRALTKKTLTLDTGETRVWTYDYDQPSGTWGQACNGYSDGYCSNYSKYFFTPSFDLGHAATAPSPYDIKKRTAIDPLGHKQVYHINVDWLAEYNGQYKVGGFIKQEKFATATSTTPLQVINHDSFDAYPAIGGHPTYRNAIAKSDFHFLPSAKTVAQDGDTFTSEYSYSMDPASANFGHTSPIQTKTFSNVSTVPRVVDTVFFNDYSNWTLGLTKSVTQNGRLMATNNFNAKGRFEEQIRYGQSVGEIRYNSDGTVNELEDGIGRITKLSNWKRGKPTQIQKAYGTSDEVLTLQALDDNGWVTSSTDGKGSTTLFDHDLMGRLKQIDPPGSWTNTDINYSFPGGGGAIQTVTKGQAKETVTYDSMFQKTLEQNQALDTGWYSYINTEYDALGRVVFQSQPSASSFETKGVSTTYDGLGRVHTTTETASGAVTTHAYYDSHRHRITDPLGHWKQYTSTGYTGPGSQDYSRINEAGDRYTDIYKNIWGETESVRQRGTLNGIPVDKTQNFFYNSQRRLCGYRDKESGDTLYDYDAAGQMIAYAKGQSNASNSCPLPSGAAKVSAVYDELGRLETTDFADNATPDITRTYDDNGNLKSVYRGSGATAVNWDYAYHPDADLLVSETLSIDNKTFPITYDYNPSQHLIQQTYPTGRPAIFDVDGLGRPTGLSSWGGYKYVRPGTVVYHASGALTSLTYGNYQVYSKTLNDRLLPDRILSQRSGQATAVDLTYSYDLRGKITSITDGAVANNDRSFTYDPLGQLTTAVGPWGTLTNTMDSLGNLRSRAFSGGAYGTRSIDMTIDNRNRVSVSSDSLGTAAGGTAYRAVGYDTRGNVTSLGNLGMVYDHSDQPTLVSGTANGVGSANGNYTYDGNLKRVKSTVNGRSFYNVYSLSGRLIHVHDEDPLDGGLPERTDYLSAGGMAIARVRAGQGVIYEHSDHLGSPIAQTYTNGQIATRSNYTPFGMAMDDPNLLKDHGGFTGHIKDSATGLNYMQARYYDPVIGRFLSVDPVGFLETGAPGMFNRYSYTFNDPINMVDPDGLSPIMPDSGQPCRYVGEKGCGSDNSRGLSLNGEGNGQSNANDPPPRINSNNPHLDNQLIPGQGILLPEGNAEYGMQHIRLRHSKDGDLSTGTEGYFDSIWLENDTRFIRAVIATVLTNAFPVGTKDAPEGYSIRLHGNQEVFYQTVEGDAFAHIGFATSRSGNSYSATKRVRIVLGPSRVRGAREGDLDIITAFPVNR